MKPSDFIKWMYGRLALNDGQIEFVCEQCKEKSTLTRGRFKEWLENRAFLTDASFTISGICDHIILRVEFEHEPEAAIECARQSIFDRS